MSESATSRDDDPEATGTEQPATEQPASEPASASSSTPAARAVVLRPAPPVRALAISSLAAILGAVLIAVASNVVMTVIGAVLLALGIVLAVTALVLTSRLRSTVTLDASGLTVTRGGRQGRLAWPDVERVQEQGPQIVAVGRGEQRDLVITVPDRRTAAYADLLSAIKEHLDADRGYGP